MAKVNTSGPTAEDTSVNINWTKNMATGLIIGQMAKHTRATGYTANNTEKPNLPTLKEEAKLEYGKTVRGLNGLKKGQKIANFQYNRRDLKEFKNDNSNLRKFMIL